MNSLDTKAGIFSTRIYAAILALIAVSLLFGGGWLAILGGSLYYVIAGAALAGSAVLLWRRRFEGVWLYVAILALTMVWSLWEVGFDGWALMPRLVAWIIVGAWMLTPRLRRSLKAPSGRAAPVVRYAGWAGFAVVLAISVAVGALLHPLHPRAFDPRFRTGMGPFPSDRAPAAIGAASGEWQHWGNDQGGARFSPLTLVTPENVSKLKLAWTTSISTTAAGRDAGLENTPLMIGDTLYACNGANEIFALDAETGKIRWHVDAAGATGRVCRGVAYYRVPSSAGLCAARILASTGSASLLALDARTGQRCPGFGTAGAVDLREGLSKAPEGYYYVTSAPAIIAGKVVLGGWISDGQYWGEPSGVIRAFDAVTGKLAWAWDMGRPDRVGAPAEGETYTPATPNSWAPISADESLGLVYLPMGNATPDYFGAQRRPFDDRYSSSIVALDAKTGRLRWSFQTVHHDLWDYDVPAQPTLVDLPMAGGTRRALVQVTKRGEIFLLDRVTGQPIHSVVERPTPQRGGVPEERLSRTQPFSIGLPSFGNPGIREADMWGITPLDQLYCRIRFREARFEGTMTPPGLTPWISSPGYVGGMDWGGASIDVDHGVMLVNSAKLANYSILLSRKQADAMGLKPLGDGAAVADVGGPAPQRGTPYAVVSAPFMSPLGIPCQAPPYGYLSAVDLVTGKLIWSHPLGAARDMGPMGVRSRLPIMIGTPMTGGSITTRSGLVFMAATPDRTFRAFDVRTGRRVWQTSLPSSGFATPMTYVSPASGRQFVVLAVGRLHGMGPAGSATLMAFALPK